jgi:hypothetical protein
MPLLFGLLALCALLAAAPAQAAPAQLLGKSVVISFTENRVQRMSDWADFRPMTIRGDVSVYISSAGRPFARLRMIAPRGQTGTAERVGNQARGATSFKGNTMTSVGIGGGGDARRTVVTFSAGFTSCEATMVRAKPAGQSMIRAKSLIRPGISNEIRSIEITGISCRVVDGNVFAGG